MRGKVLPVGGIKEKILAARRAGIETVLIPVKNEKDLMDVPEHLRKPLTLVPVKDISEVLGAALSPLVLARAESIPGEARKARLRESGGRRRDRIKPRAIAQDRRQGR